MANILIYQAFDSSLPRDECRVYSLDDAREISRPVPAGLEVVNQQHALVEGREYYARVDKKGQLHGKLYAGVARLVGNEPVTHGPWIVLIE